MGRPCFRRVEVWPRMVAQAVAPSGLRWDPEIFCWVVAGRRSRSAPLLVKGTPGRSE